MVFGVSYSLNQVYFIESSQARNDLEISKESRDFARRPPDCGGLILAPFYLSPPLFSETSRLGKFSREAPYYK